MGSGNLVPRKYASFRGVDFRGEEVNFTRSPDALNMWKDYRETDSIRTRPEMELLEHFDTPVHGVFFYSVGSREMMMVHSGVKLYKIENGQREELFTGLKPARSQAFVFNNIWYFKDGLYYLRFDGESLAEVEGYVPTTSIGRSPAGGGTVYQDVNLLSPYRTNTFLGDGESVDYYLDSPSIDGDFVPEIYVDGKKVTGFTMDAATGKITFNSAPAEPLTDGQDNVSITYKKVTTEHRDRICKCDLLQVFDNRVFFSGHEDYPNAIFHSSLNDPTYCSDLDYYNEGLDPAPVKAMVAGNNALWVFKEPSQADTAIFYHNPGQDDEYGKVYPSVHSSISTGCVATGINFNDDIVFFSERGMEAISGDVTTEQVIAHRSAMVDRKLLSEERYKKMFLEEWEGYLFVITGSNVYLADSRAMFTNENHAEYEWFYWELGKEVTCTRVHGGALYLGTNDGIYTLSDLEGDVACHWTTPLDKFKHPQYLKTTNKRGCTVEAKGDITVHVKTNRSEWERVKDYKDITDYFVCRIKRKKFKDIQMKFSSMKRFVLESVTLECFIGGYIKR